MARRNVPPEEAALKQPARMLYMGARTSHDGKKRHHYVEVGTEPGMVQNNEEAASIQMLRDGVGGITYLFITDAPLGPGLGGNIYEYSVLRNDIGVIKTIFTKPGTAGRSWIESWKNKTDRSEWQALDMAAEDHARQSSKGNKEANHNWVYEALDPIREAYQDSNSTTRTLILARVINYITRTVKT